MTVVLLNHRYDEEGGIVTVMVKCVVRKKEEEVVTAIHLSVHQTGCVYVLVIAS